ncbi:sulfur oxidation c-type cytochrome SoxX [Nisaea sp.]|uniref:sulfur oxidation c-type cytochrome SoxX n=1 Tax=Nisaea sp. TaxID=2024842 RepID=UPI003264C574
MRQVEFSGLLNSKVSQRAVPTKKVGGDPVIRVVVTTVLALMLGISGVSAETVKPGDVKIVDGEVVQALTDKPGDPQKGRQWFMGRKLGNCLACHANSDLADQPYHGEVGPPLDGVADRWSVTELRAIVINSKEALSPETIMPGFYRDAGLNRVAKKFAGKTVLTAQQVEDVVAYLMTLKEE